MKSRIHYEAELGELHRYHQKQMHSCPDARLIQSRSRLAVFRAAARLPESAFGLLSFLAGAHPGPAFLAMARRLEKAR
jgi:hypothetical protein